MKRLGIDREAKMAVVVQRQVNPKLSGVLFTCSPNESDKALVEFVKGFPEKLVGGKRAVSVSFFRATPPRSKTP